MFPAAGATAAAVSQDAAPTAPTQRQSYAAVAAAAGEGTAREQAEAMPLKPFRMPETLHSTLGKTAPFVPAGIAVLDPAIAEAVLARSAVWVHLCSEEYADPAAAFVNERFALRFAAARAAKITFFRAPGVKPFFVFEKLGAKTYTPFLNKLMTVLKLAGEDAEDGPEVLRFTGPETNYAEMDAALQGIPHRKLSHQKDLVRMYEVIVPDESTKAKLAAVALVEERRAVVSSRYEAQQVTIRPKQRRTPEQLFLFAKTFSSARGALLKQGAIRMRFASQEAAMTAVASLKSDWHVIFDVPPKHNKSAEALPSWSQGMTLPEPKEVWALKSLNSRSPEVFEEAAQRLNLHIFKLPTFTLALVEAKDGANLKPLQLSTLDAKFRGMTLDLLDRF